MIKPQCNAKCGAKGILVNSIYNYPRGMTFFSTSENTSRIENDFVSALTGYKPDFSISRKSSGSNSSAKKIPEHRKETPETDVKNIFLADVICGGTETHKWVIENSRIPAEIAVAEIAERKNNDAL